MHNLTRRSTLRASVALAGATALARPHIANAAATTANGWWTQGFVPEEDAAFRAMVADYEKASGNKIEYSIVPFAALRQKEVAAVTSGVVPDFMEVADLAFGPLNAWKGNLLDVTDVVATQQGQYPESALLSNYYYNRAERTRHFYVVPMKGFAVPFHVWKSLIEQAGAKIADIPKTWDAFLDFFKPLQDRLRKAGRRKIYAYGYQLTTNGVDPELLFYQWLIAYGGKDFVAPDGRLHTANQAVREAAIKALTNLTSAYKGGYVPPGVINWNDADDNNAFHSKLTIMDFDGSISTELALFHDKEEYNDILTMGLPLGNDGREIPGVVAYFGPVIPKGAKNVAVAKEFLKYAIQPKVLDRYLKGGLGRWVVPMPAAAKRDPFWTNPNDQHIATYTALTLFRPTVPVFVAYNPAMAQVAAEHVFQRAAFDVMKSGVAPEAAIGKAFKRVETIFAAYPITQS